MNKQVFVFVTVLNLTLTSSSCVSTKGKPAIYHFKCLLGEWKSGILRRPKSVTEKCVQLVSGPPPARELGTAWLCCCPPWPAALPLSSRQDSGVSRCCRGAALITAWGTSSSANTGVLCVPKPGPACGTALSEPVGWLPADLSAFLFSERDRSRVHLLDALRLACSCEDHSGVGGKARRALPPRVGQGSKASFHLRSWALTPKK